MTNLAQEFSAKVSGGVIISLLSFLLSGLGHCTANSPATAVQDTSSLCKAVMKNDDYFAHGVIVFSEDASSGDQSSSRTGTLTYCGDYFSCISTYDKAGKACSFVGKHSYAQWDAGDAVAVETWHPERNPWEIMAAMPFGRSGPPSIRRELCGEGHESLPDFLAEQTAKGANVNISSKRQGEWVITVNGKANARGTWTYIFLLQSRADCAAVAEFRSLHNNRLTSEFKVDLTNAKDAPYFLPKTAAWSAYGTAGVDPNDQARESAIIMAGKTVVKSFIPSEMPKQSCDFDSASLSLPAGVRLEKHEVDGSVTVMDSLGDGKLKNVEVLGPELASLTNPMAAPSDNRPTLVRLLQLIAIIAALISVVLFVRPRLSQRRKT